jgi:hypothetical protein
MSNDIHLWLLLFFQRADKGSAARNFIASNSKLYNEEIDQSGPPSINDI